LCATFDAERQERRQPGLELLPGKNVETEPAERRRALKPRGRRGVGRALEDLLEQEALGRWASWW
jgi:hypothetical protein